MPCHSLPKQEQADDRYVEDRFPSSEFVKERRQRWGWHRCKLLAGLGGSAKIATVFDDQSRFVFQAHAYEWAADHLYSELDKLAKQAQSQGKADLNEHAKEAMGCASGSVVLRALAAEMALKAIIIKQGEDYPRIHDLLKLYEQLSVENRRLIEAMYQAWCEQNRPPINTVQGTALSPPLSQVLREHRRDAVAWRYLDEPNLNTTFHDLPPVVAILIAAMTQLPLQT